MCGFVGYIDPRAQLSGDRMTTLVDRMAASLAHRGPDDNGTWCDQTSGVALAHRRLSILDLSPAGRQPMVSACGNYVLVYNGEIYNYQDIRRQLENECGPLSWRGTSDTEVVLTAIAHWGLQRSLAEFNGMFAFALWDARNRTLTLARDRIGEKPLYYGYSHAVFFFGSELKAFRAHPDWQGEVSPHAVSLVLQFGYIPAPHSIYRGFLKLKPGTYLTLHYADIEKRFLPDPIPYWSAESILLPGSGMESDCSPDQALEMLLRDAVRIRMISDVPIGAFLSGGIDSSTIAALMQTISERPIKTFTVGFSEKEYNEAEHARLVARFLGTEHTELHVTPEDARSVIPDIPRYYDEPFADSSQVPTLLISRLTRRYVTVCLSGDAGDELFSGYDRYFWANNANRMRRVLPHALRSMIASALAAPSPASLATVYRMLLSVSARAGSVFSYDKIMKMCSLLTAKSDEDIYHTLIAQWGDAADVMQEKMHPRMNRYALPERGKDLWLKMRLLDLQTYLPDDILVKVDRGSMASSLETRIPFLDHRVIEFALRLPSNTLIHKGVGKQAVRRIAYRLIPEKLLSRPKSGFRMPIAAWLRGPLREWAEDLLDEKKIRHEGFLKPQLIRRKWKEHLSGEYNWQYQLWPVLMFEAWLAQCNRHH